MTKKVPEAIQQMLATIQQMSLSDAYHYGSMVRDAMDKKQRQWWGSDEQIAEQKARQTKNAAKREADAKRAAARVVWVTENLKPGMIVKMSGTRDGHGVRYVVDIDRGTVLCRQMSPTHRMGRTIDEMHDEHPNKMFIRMGVPSDPAKYSIWEVTNAGTDHGIDKVMGVFTPNVNGFHTYKAIK